MMSDLSQKKIWENGIQSELNYWDRWFKDEGGRWADDYRLRMDPLTPLKPHIAPLLPAGAEPVRILDVGSGPITNIGFHHPAREIEIVAADPLADGYNAIMERYGVTPVVAPVKCEAERLLDIFQPGSFDLVHSSNALDHSYDPLEAIRQMLEVCRPGGKVFISLYRNEGISQNYAGLHQWNFDEHQGKVIVFSKRQARYLDEISGPQYLFSMSFPQDASQFVKAKVNITIFKQD